jgi:hypothetical protein
MHIRLPARLGKSKGLTCGPMVLVPKGELIMGSEPGAFIFGDNGTHRRHVFLDVL